MKKNPAAVALGRLGGKSKSEAKINAVRENGKKGGRPKKIKKETNMNTAFTQGQRRAKPTVNTSNLIAAAPELYAALKELKTQGLSPRAWEMITAALAKAEGKQLSPV